MSARTPTHSTAHHPQPGTERWRPAYHFTPARNWMNDPNGLVFHDDTWHLFFQHNPDASTWGNMSWGHATSRDLVTWTEHPVALRHLGLDVCDEDSREEAFSGSVVVDHRNTSGFGGADGPPLVAVYTSARPGHQSQSLAYSTDGGLTWSRHTGNPVLDRRSAAFRDPKVTWWEPESGEPGFWLLVAVEATERKVVFYRSPDLRQWELSSELGPFTVPDGVWECPDLFALPIDGNPRDVRHVLVMSANDERSVAGCGTWYVTGRFDGAAFTPDGTGFRRLDHGPDCYAAVTWEGAPHGRRVLLGWMSNWAYARDLPTHPWSGAMTLPRDLTLETRGQGVRLIQRPVPELDRYDVKRHALDLDTSEARTVEVEVPGTGAQALRLRYDRDTGLLSLDRRGAGQAARHPAFTQVVTAPVQAVGGVVRVNVVVDRCSVEVFAGDGEVVLTALGFPSET